MTASDWNKIIKQIKHKPAKLQKFMKNNVPKKRTTGIALKKCIRTGRIGAHIKKYNLNLCRQAFREIAEEIGFKKYS